jgi:hypothetical protein
MKQLSLLLLSTSLLFLQTSVTDAGLFDWFRSKKSRCCVRVTCCSRPRPPVTCCAPRPTCCQPVPNYYTPATPDVAPAPPVEEPPLVPYE